MPPGGWQVCATSTRSATGESASKASDADRQRLQQLKVSLDQCWDLLRQRRAAEAAGQQQAEGVAEWPAHAPSSTRTSRIIPASMW